MTTGRSILVGLASLLLIGLSLMAHAQTESGLEQARKLQSAVDAMQKVLQPGPIEVDLDELARLKIPQGAAFVKQPEAGDWAATSGYSEGTGLAGMLVPTGEGQSWVVFIEHHPGIRIVDEEAASWNADDLLQGLTASTEQDNPRRKSQGLSEIEVKGWLEKPTYDAAAHRLTWATNSTGKDSDDDGGSAEVHGFVLGRDGYFEIRMVSPSVEVASHLSIFRTIVSGLEFDAGQRYADFVAGQDIRTRTITSLVSDVAPEWQAQALRWLYSIWAWILAVVILAILLLVALRRRARG